MATVSTITALALAAAAAGTQYYNTEKTAERQDNQLAASLRNQSGKQKQADAKVNDEVQKLAQSTSADERRKGLDDYMTALRQNKGKLEAGLTPIVGSTAFREDAANTAAGVQDYGARTADLMSRMDAPIEQRRGEGFGYGNLATDLGLIGREAQGQNFLDELRLRAIRRNAGLDFASSLMGAGAGAAAGAAGAGAGAGAGDTAFGYQAYGSP